ncbi:hypothetical protein SISSUDRAFT_1118220 [Sistotremastrum suecicum HHB10207 ss-3]|nr:hypothetical protein SISSUDRAFT_1118220 [Sistotremastrum suecicum HHB10207 ss-3]
MPSPRAGPLYLLLINVLVSIFAHARPLSSSSQTDRYLINGPYGVPYHEEGKPVVLGGHNLTVGKYLWSGRTGEYYDVFWPPLNSTIVIKQFYIWWWGFEIEREIDNLKEIGQFVLFDQYDGRRWIAMEKKPGHLLTKTKAFKAAYKHSRHACDAVVERIYEPVFNEIIDLVARHGIYHNISFTRAVFSDDISQVHLVDFGDDERVDPASATQRAFRERVALDIYKTWPNDGRSYADCLIESVAMQSIATAADSLSGTGWGFRTARLRLQLTLEPLGLLKGLEIVGMVEFEHRSPTSGSLELVIGLRERSWIRVNTQDED